MKPSWLQRKSVVMVLVVLGMCFLLAPSAHAGKELRWSNTTRQLGPGFGDQWNKYAWSMQDYKGHMYVGMNNGHYDVLGAIEDPDFLACVENLPPDNPFAIFACFVELGYKDSGPAQIWRYDYKTRTWEQVYGLPADPVKGGFRKMIAYEDKLYASSSNFTGLAELLVTENGVDWAPVPNPGGLQCWSYRALAVYDDWLYVGSDCGNLWRFDGAAWEEVADNLGPVGIGVAELAVYRDKLYAGSGDPPLGILLFEIDTNGTVADVTPAVVDGVDLSTLGNLGVGKLYVYRGMLFLGTANYTRGFTFLRYNGFTDKWRVITVDGFGYDRNTYVWSMARFRNKLYMGTFTSDFMSGLVSGSPDLGDLDISLSDILGLAKSSAQLWRSADGMHWEQLELPKVGFGLWCYGFRNMEVGHWGRKLFLGTATNLFAPDLDPPLQRWLGPGTKIWAIR